MLFAMPCFADELYTVKPDGGGNYLTLQAAETDNQGDLTGRGVVTFECYDGTADLGECTVAGWTKCKTFAQPTQHWLKITQNRRSESVRFGRGPRNFSVANCCRRAMFSSVSSLWLRTLDRSVPRITFSHFHIKFRPLDSMKKDNKIKCDD